MADDPKAPSLNLTPEEKRVFGQLFRQADTENIGVVTGEVAVKFFEKTRLDPSILGEIWQIADTENRGLLTPAGFGIVLRLIGHYQAGRNPTPELALRPGPLPKFDGGPGGPNTTVQPPPGPPPSALQPQSSGSGPIRVPPLTPEKVNQYAALFEKSGAVNGVLPGEQAKQIFERAGLPNEVLGRIWMLSDTEARGALVITEFVIAMHLLASFKSGAMRTLPNVLPAGLYEAAARRAPSRQGSGVNTISAIPRQFSGVSGRASSPLSRPAYGPPQQQAPQSTGVGNDWAITPTDKAKFDSIFATQDTSNKGYITGEEAVRFFSESKLPEEALAQIWDLADINSVGQLTRDEFAVAMFLIRQQRGRRDGRDSLPTTLPPNLIPPSMRHQVRPAAVPTAPAFDNPAPAMPKSAADDLFGLDALSSPPPPAAQAPQSTGGSGSFAPRQANTDPFGNGPLTPTSPAPNSPQQSTVFKPFAPSSSFGQSLTYNATGGSTSSSGQLPPRGFQQQQQPSASEDLLGDNDPEISKKLTSETSELANLSNQVGTLSQQMQEVQGQRNTSQAELTQAGSQKREFEIRLAQLRSHYEQEAKDVKILQEKLVASRNETKKLQTEIAMIEGTYQDLQTRHRETVAALQADQQENANLKERMRVVNAEIAQLKPSLEKLRSDARQQKGLVAINKKQLATNEQERDKLKTEAGELTKSIEEDTKALEAASRGVQSQPAPVASPAPSTASGNNPFFRRQGSTSEISTSPFASSPPPQKQSERSFEDVFGPSFAVAAVTQDATPPTSFRQENVSSPAPSSIRDISGAHVPPPPPESRQLSSSFLPFPSAQDASLSSSRQVSAPNSRNGDGSTGADTPTGYIGTTPTGSSAAGLGDEPRGTSPELDRKSTASPAASEARANLSKDSIPGAFPGDTNSYLTATPTGGSNLSEQASADPFAISKDPVRPGTSKDDFDAAFAGFGSSAKKQEPAASGNSSNDGSASGVPAGFNKEFPPIAELENDDDSDSASEGGGFDDDFTSASPGHTRKASSSQIPTLSQHATDSTSNGTDFLAARPGTATAASTRTDPPTPGAQVSPPTYEKTVSPGDEAQADLGQYSGLLPSRENPISSSPAEHASTSSPSASQPPFEAPQAHSQPVPPAKVPFDDDFGNDFDDLEDAKEGDVDDDFANLSAHDRAGIDDFNAVFDSPTVPSKGTAHNDDFGVGNSGFGDFTQSPHPAQQQPTTTSAINDNHDWDAIFAGLDQPAAETGSQTTETAPETAQPSNGTNLTPTSKERPPLGRAPTEASEHDDPILKNLTGMGYARNDALAALEKYDYNLERAANYLASQS